jgi:transcriptional regulator NrdR family protein
MVCIYCNGKTRIANSRRRQRDKSVWRRHKCIACNAIFTTVEQIDWSQALLFKNDNAHVEPFSRDKLLISVHHSLKHRKDAAVASTALTDTILNKLMAQIEHASLTRSQVIDITNEVLKKFDKASSISYTAFHPKKPQSTS